MIHFFKVANYKSVKEEILISFLAESLKQRVKENTYPLNDRDSLLKSIVFYGANASGKSNIIKALAAMRAIVVNSASYIPDQEIDVEPFELSINTLDQPTFFEITFSLNDSVYRYGFKVSRKEIVEEWLFLVLKTTEKLYFKRINQDLEINNNFQEGHGRDKFVKENSLFLSTLANLNATISTEIVKYFNQINILTDINYTTFTNLTAKYLNDTQFGDIIIELFKKMGLHEISEAIIKTENFSESSLNFLSDEVKLLIKKSSPKQLKITTKHNRYDGSGNILGQVEFDLSKESLGTQKIFAIAGVIVYALKNGMPVIIDELDARLHPVLLEFIVKIFCSETSNIYGSQLLFTSHNTSILNSGLLRRDQAYLISKPKNGTKAKTLHKLNVRSDASFEKDYLAGEYGSIPNIELNQYRLF